MIIRLKYQASDEDIRCEYESVSDLCLEIEHDSYSSADGSSDEGRKYQEITYDQE